jgi:Asp-tRNA(Asn)/Glu-tRNA(Gln) amidotransferase A subunit family amidase
MEAESTLHPHPLAATVAALRSGQVTLSTHINDSCDRVEQVDAQVESLLPEPGRRERLLIAAKELTTRFPEPAARPPLYGALIGVKDIFHVDGFVTRSGSRVPPEPFAGPEAACIQQLCAAGALVLGKTVTTEFAYFEPGPTRNPHNLAHTPGGSSSGSAAAVAAGLCGLALGTQTIGSVIRPAAFCGIVGFKPSYDRIATPGLVYFSRTVDHVGLFTQDVAGMQLAASVLCADWQPDPIADARPILGVPDGPYLEQTEPAALSRFSETLVQLQRAGYGVRHVPALADIAELNHLHRRLVFAEFAREHAASYAAHAALYRPRTAEAIEIGRTVDADELAAARASCLQRRAALEQQMEEAGIDLWICPPAPGPAPEGIHATGDPNMNLPWTHAGMPVVTVPTGQTVDGLPLGLQIVARFGRDEQLLTWAEQITTALNP